MKPHLPLTRRGALLGLGAALTLGRASLALASAPTERRLVVVLMRGALDGMTAVVPYGDPALASLRAELIPGAVGSEGGMRDLGGFYGLHPSLAAMHAMYLQGELLPVHAVAGHYRTRSHFDGQDYMESGADERMSSGWLNRAVALLPARPGVDAALAVGGTLPLLLRGTAPVGAWAPPIFNSPDTDLYARIAALHQADPVTGPAILEGLKERGFSSETLGGVEKPKNVAAFPALAAVAGRFLAVANGPRIAALEIGGWDTHAGQVRRLGEALAQLDAGMAALKDNLGEAWRETAVLVVTEFGRTARVNGTRGTDHGTGTVAFVAGGRIAGGRVLANWPGLAPGRLLEARDLQPTMDLRSVAKALLVQHLGLPAGALLSVFPDSRDAAAAPGLVRA